MPRTGETMADDILAIDFGTSNSAVAVLEQGRPRRIPIEAGHETLPTAVFFPASGGSMRIGESAAAALIGGEEGRYMRALKSVLGTSLLHEARLIGKQRRSVSQIIAAFLAELRCRAEAATGRSFRRALSGRPVHFHGNDPERDTRALQDLRDCYLAAGFDEVRFLPEPEAAALTSPSAAQAGDLGLVVDIGGGTSDFTVFRHRDGGRPEILASHGIRLGGTDFDHALSMAHAMPALGHGGQLRREMGPGLLPVPNAIYADLATWAKIPFLYTPETCRMAAGMARLAIEPQKMNRLVAVLEDELGHDLAFAVERGKIAANGGANDARIAMDMIARGLSQPLTRDMLDRALAQHGEALHQAAAETLRLAGVAPGSMAQVVLVGGSSLMALVADAAQRLCPGVALQRAGAFTAVVDGLALASGDG